MNRRRFPRIRIPSWMPVDPYILALIATVALGALLPVSGRAADVAGGASRGTVALMFFLYGARLSTREMADGLRHWRLHLTVLACTFMIFPLFGLAARGLVPFVLTPQLYSGLLFLCLVSSTVQSSIGFTSIARGNVPAAICAGSFSSLLGIMITPLLAALLIGGGAAGFSADSMFRIVAQLLLPFLAGQSLRRWVAGFLTRRRRLLGLVDRASVLLVVYTAFSQGMGAGVWHQVTPARLAVLLGVDAVLLAAMLTLSWYGGRRLGFGRADRIAIQFAGSNKSLAAGLPMASVLFGTHASLAVLPLMLFHPMQVMTCAVLAKRRARDPRSTGLSGPSGIPEPSEPRGHRPPVPPRPVRPSPRPPTSEPKGAPLSKGRARGGPEVRGVEHGRPSTPA